MTVLFTILGVLLVIGGISCMFTPLATLLAAGYLIGILLLVYGIFGIVRAITEKGGALDWILSILALAIGLFSFFRPDASLGAYSGIIIVLLAGFFLVQGIVHIVTAIKTRFVNKNWVWSLIVGILAAILGIFCFVYPMFTAVTAGVLIGFFFVMMGISMISMAFVSDSGEA